MQSVTSSESPSARPAGPPPAGAAPARRDVAADLEVLRAELRALGCYERPFGTLVVTWLALLVVGVAGLAAFIAIPHWAARTTSLMVSCTAFLGLATLAHTASHRGASDRRVLNDIMWYATYPFLLQLSARYWHWSHIQLHHPAPNVLGVDLDCDLRPTFAINERHVAEASPTLQRWYRVQGWFFPLALLFNGVNVQRQGWQKLLSLLAHRETRTAAVWADLACMLGHLVVWIALPMLFFPPASVLGVYALRTVIMGTGLFAILAPGHFPAAAACLDGSQRDEGDFYLRQAVSTVNFRTGWLGSLICSGLEFQIEHHLFPSVSHLHLRKMSPLVRAFCEKQGLPYNSMSWPRAIWESYRVLFHPKPVYDDVEALRRRT